MADDGWTDGNEAFEEQEEGEERGGGGAEGGCRRCGEVRGTWLSLSRTKAYNTRNPATHTWHLLYFSLVIC